MKTNEEYLMGKCKGCGRPILWAETVAGKKMPFDASEESHWTIKRADDGINYCYRQAVYVPHWGSCPKARDFRKKVVAG